MNFIIIILFVFGFCLENVNTKEPDWDTYTREELKKIPELRTRVAGNLTHRCMTENKYLVRFLRARNLNVDRAVNMMEEFFRYRKKYDIDNLIFKDFTNLERQLPFYYIRDYDGRPGLVGGLRDFSIRKLIISTGNVERIRTYLLYIIERSTWNIHVVANETGRELIEGYLLFNMAGFTLRNQACAACLPLWLELAVSYESYYPQLAYKIIVINVPRVFERIYTFLKPFGSGHTLKALRLYSLDKSEWMPELRKIFPIDQLEPEFGGTANNLKLYKLTRHHVELLLGESYANAVFKQKALI